MRLVLGTNVVVTAFRSLGGASAELIALAREGAIEILMSPAMALEYEAVCTRRQHMEFAGVTRSETWLFVDAIIAIAEPGSIWFSIRPQLPDPSDEIILEAAVNGRATAIVSFNTRHFLNVPSRFGIALWTPADVIRNLK